MVEKSTSDSQQTSQKSITDEKFDSKTAQDPQVIDLTQDSTPVENLVDFKTEHQRKAKVFMDWCTEGGMIFPKLEYPAYFEDGLIGVRALDKIEHRESFLAIPYKFLMTVQMAQKHPVLS